MKSKHICPKCGGKRFAVKVPVMQTWIVNSYGEFMEAVEELGETIREPDDNSIWTCTECGAEGVIIDFSKPYIQACLENPVFVKTINDYNEAWPRHVGEKKTLREYLGMTEEEYRAWTEKGNDIIDRILSCRKRNIPFALEEDSNYAKFQKFINMYKPGQYVYPDAIHRNTNMDMQEIYIRCNADETLKPAYTWKCPNCLHTTVYENLCDIPETICCEHCDAEYPVDIGKDIEVIFKKT